MIALSGKKQISFFKSLMASTLLEIYMSDSLTVIVFYLFILFYYIFFSDESVPEIGLIQIS